MYNENTKMKNFMESVLKGLSYNDSYYTSMRHRSAHIQRAIEQHLEGCNYLCKRLRKTKRNYFTTTKYVLVIGKIM